MSTIKEMFTKKNKYEKIGYDYNGVISQGIFTIGGIVITGMSAEHNDEIYEKVPEDTEIYNFPDQEDLTDENKDELVGKFKGDMIKMLKITKYFEDTPEQVDIIKEINPDVEVILVDNKVDNKKEEEPEEEFDDTKRHFIICSQDFTGLGWAKIFQDEGNGVLLAYKLKDDDEKEKEAKTVGKGIIPVKEMDKIFADRKKYKESYWIFDMNYLSEYAEKLRKEGFKVFGAQKISDEMEHDRKYATDIIEEYGLETPPTTEFNNIPDGLKFLQENEEKAYVFKPDGADESWSTFVPDSEKDEAANKELQTYMESLPSKNDTYILQERIKGVEANFEVWIYEGKPFFAFCSLECKRKLNHDYGENVGCAQEINFIIPLECKAIKETLAKLFPFYKDIKYTGFADMNVIISDNKPYFLEVCNRLGYNAHPTLMLGLARDKVSNIFADFIDGKVENFYNKFKYGFGSSITLMLDHSRSGMPLYISEEVCNKFYMFDGYMKEDQIFTSGYCQEIGIITGHGFSVKNSAEDCLKSADKINFPMRGMRSDLDLDNYNSSPLLRKQSLDAMHYFDIDKYY